MGSGMRLQLRRETQMTDRTMHMLTYNKYHQVDDICSGRVEQYSYLLFRRRGAHLKPRRGGYSTMTTLTALRVPGLMRIVIGYEIEELQMKLLIACCDGRLADARWLWGLGLTLEDVRVDGARCLRAACNRGYLEIARWLWGLGIRFDERDDVLRLYSNNLPTIQWIWSMGTLTLDNVRERDNYVFRQACRLDRLDVAQWLWGLGLTIDDVRANDNAAIRGACKRCNSDMVRWLWSLGLTHDDVQAIGAFDHDVTCSRGPRCALGDIYRIRYTNGNVSYRSGVDFPVYI